MESIIRLVSNPEWWFSAIFISVATGVFASYAKDWLTKTLSFGSKKFKERATKRKADIDMRIECFVRNPILLIIANQEVTQLILVFLLCLMISMGFPIYNTFLIAYPEMDAISSVLKMRTSHAPQEISALISVTSAIAALFAEMKILSRTRVCQKAKLMIKNQTISKISEDGRLHRLP